MFQWEEYFQLAQNLEQQSSAVQIPEAYLRSAVSRAYYAAFNKAKLFAVGLGYTFPYYKNPKDSNKPLYSTHRDLFHFLEQQETLGNVQSGAIARSLKQCQRDRTDCDYNNPLQYSPIDITKKFAKVSIRVKEILSTI